jgi:hypothetical protein
VKKETALVLSFLCLLLISVSALETRLGLGKKEGFRSVSRLQGITVDIGGDGGSELMLKDRRMAAEESTDLLLGFDEEPVRDEAGRWALRNENVAISASHRFRGHGSAAFQEKSRLGLLPGKTALLAPGTSPGDFTIEFWLYPATLEEGETIFYWRSAPTSAASYQEISCGIFGRVLVWEFKSFFRSPGIPAGNILLRGRRQIIPREWRHHLLHYNSADGIVEYLIDGVPEDIAYASPSGREENSVLYPLIEKGNPSPLYIGEGFTGFIDELRITRGFIEKPDLTAFSPEGGWLETDPLDLGHINSRLLRLESKMVLPADSAIFFYYRTGNNPQGMQGGEWRPILAGAEFPKNTLGRYIALRAEIFPDGGRSRSPRISDIQIVYEKSLPPPPPSFVAATPGDGAVSLRWARVPDPALTGYFVYYGTRPGVYDGNESSLGPSPVKIGKQTEILMDGLVNGKLYYFAVSSYDAGEDPLNGQFSHIVSARPSRIYRNEKDTRQ